MSAATETTVKKPTTTEDVPSQVPAEVEAKSAEAEGFRVYFGNLSYKTKEEQVREFASKPGGEILTVILPQRFKRPSGFAFVHYKTEEDANKAVEQLNEQELDGRQVRLQVARSREEQAARRESIIAKRNADREARQATEGEKKATEGETQEDAAKPKKRNAKAGRRRVPGNESDEAEGDAAEAAETTANGGEAAEKKKSKPKKKAAKAPKAAEEARIDGDATDAPAEEKKEKKEKKPKVSQKKLELSDSPSPNTVFVANLPFTVDDDALAAIFTNLSINVKSAKVVTGLRRPRGGKPFRASRGFGFVEIEDDNQQKEAVEKVDGSLIGDRKISAKIANEMKPVEQAEVSAAADEEAKADAAPQTSA